MDRFPWIRDGLAPRSRLALAQYDYADGMDSAARQILSESRSGIGSLPTPLRLQALALSCALNGEDSESIAEWAALTNVNRELAADQLRRRVRDLLSSREKRSDAGLP